MFYHEYGMPDKLNYIKTILDSCKTPEQLDATFEWGKKVLWGFSDVICKKIDNSWDELFPLSVTLSIIKRTGKLETDLKRHYKNLSKKFQYGEN